MVRRVQSACVTSASASVMKLMIQYDFNIVTEEDILRVMKSSDTNLQR